MKGVIPNCLAKLIKSKFGKDKWEDCLEAAGLPRNSTFLATEDIPDADVITVVESVCNTLDMTLEQAADAFGEYWVNDYAPNVYSAYYRQSNSAKEFLLNMDSIHKKATHDIPNAHPPRFDYDWRNEKTLVMNYKSSRGLIDILIGLIKGVGTYYKEDLRITKLGDDKVQVVFS